LPSSPFSPQSKGQVASSSAASPASYNQDGVHDTANQPFGPTSPAYQGTNPSFFQSSGQPTYANAPSSNNVLYGRPSSGHGQNLGFTPVYSSNINQGYQSHQGLHSGYGLPSKGLGAIVEGRYNAELGSAPGNLHYEEIDQGTLK
jgi:hypothetical protein